MPLDFCLMRCYQFALVRKQQVVFLFDQLPFYYRGLRMEQVKPHWLFFALTGSLLLAACSNSPTNPASNQPSPSNQSSPSPTSTAPATVIGKSPLAQNVTFTAAANPVKVCDGTGMGSTTISYQAPAVTHVQLRMGKVDGGLVAYTTNQATVKTGKWVYDGLVLYLQDVSNGKPLTPENTLATLTLKVTTEGCP
jgi:hypothetical protein